MSDIERIKDLKWQLEMESMKARDYSNQIKSVMDKITQAEQLPRTSENFERFIATLKYTLEME